MQFDSPLEKFRFHQMRLYLTPSGAPDSPILERQREVGASLYELLSTWKGGAYTAGRRLGLSANEDMPINLVHTAYVILYPKALLGLFVPDNGAYVFNQLLWAAKKESRSIQKTPTITSEDDFCGNTVDPLSVTSAYRARMQMERVLAPFEWTAAEQYLILCHCTEEFPNLSDTSSMTSSVEVFLREQDFLLDDVPVRIVGLAEEHTIHLVRFQRWLSGIQTNQLMGEDDIGAPAISGSLKSSRHAILDAMRTLNDDHDVQVLEGFLTRLHKANAFLRELIEAQQELSKQSLPPIKSVAQVRPRIAVLVKAVSEHFGAHSWQEQFVHSQWRLADDEAVLHSVISRTALSGADAQLELNRITDLVLKEVQSHVKVLCRSK